MCSLAGSGRAFGFAPHRSKMTEGMGQTEDPTVFRIAVFGILSRYTGGLSGAHTEQ